jgi:hypothetical protein
MEIYKKGGKKNKSKFKRVSQDKLDDIRANRNAPLERMLRRIGMNKKYKDVDDDPDGGEGQMVCTKDGCEQGGADAEKSAEFNDPKNQPKDPFALRVANFMAKSRRDRQDKLADRKSRVLNRTTFATDPRRGEYKEFRNPFARMRYRGIQRKEARSKGRSDSGQGMQYIQSPEF